MKTWKSQIEYSPEQDLYEHGLPFTADLARTIDSIKQRIERNKAAVIIIDGASGEGKTTLAAHIAQYYAGREISPDEIDKWLGAGFTDFRRKLISAYDDQIPAVIYDEAGDYASRRAMSKLNAELNRVWETYRTFQVLVIICLPDFSKLDKSIFDYQVPRVLLNCHDRRKKWGRFRGYSLRRMYYLLDWHQKLKVPPQKYQKVHPNQRGIFKDVRPELSEKLANVSREQKRSIINGTSDSDGEKLYSYQDLSQAFDISVQRIQSLVKQFRIERKKTIDRRAYFDKEAVRELEKYYGVALS